MVKKNESVLCSSNFWFDNVNNMFYINFICKCTVVCDDNDINGDAIFSGVHNGNQNRRSFSEGQKMKEKCVHCQRELVFSKDLQEMANKGMRDAGNCVIPDGWYCPVCDY
jgi:hypothetical protein